MRTFAIVASVLLAAGRCFAADPAQPVIAVAEDGFPEGGDTPEGAACDLARAFIRRDAALFKATCIRLYAGGDGPEDYARFLESTIESVKEEAAKEEPSPGGPVAIGKVFAARRLSKNGPASYGWAAFGFQDVMFVDVGVYLGDGRPSLTRTLVIKDRDGRWYVHPLPGAGSGLLGMGLNDEAPSERDFSEAYEIRQ